MLRFLISILIFGFCVRIFVKAFGLWTMRQARKRGMSPPFGQATLFDVKRLLMQGKDHLAVRVYRDIFQVSYIQAKEAVEELKNSLPKS